MKSKIGGFILFMVLAAGPAFGQKKELSCNQQGHDETQLTLDYDNHTAFFHDGEATEPTSAEFTEDAISWHALRHGYRSSYILNRNTGTLQIGRNGPVYSCSVSDKKF